MIHLQMIIFLVQDVGEAVNAVVEEDVVVVAADEDVDKTRAKNFVFNQNFINLIKADAWRCSSVAPS